MGIIKAEKKKVLETFTCPLCNNLFDRATTISECLHTFCRDCIRDKLINEKLKTCPVCFVDLGVAPLDKLRKPEYEICDLRYIKCRGDYSLEDMRLKIFPSLPKTIKTGPETVAASLESFKKKGKSVSSLLSSSSKVSPLEPNDLMEEKLSEKVKAVPQIKSSSKPLITFKKRDKKISKPTNNDAGLGSGQPHKEAVIKFHIDLNFGPDCEPNRVLTSQECIQTESNSEKDKGKIPIVSDLNDTPPVNIEPAISQNGKENHDNVPRSGGDAEEVFGKKLDECVEITHNKSVGNTSRETEGVPAEVNQNTALIKSNRNTNKAFGKKLKRVVKQTHKRVIPISRKIHGKKQNEKSTPVLRTRRQGTIGSEASTSETATSTDYEKKFDRSNNTVWFSLVASSNQNTDMALPQISGHFLRVKDGNTSTVSHVKKYVVQRLGLESEDEVEIWLRHEPVCSTQILRDVLNWWVETTPVEERKNAIIGSSGGDFVMVLYYSRKATS